MYSILVYVTASKTIDFLLHGIEEYTAITIVSMKNDQIKEAIINRLNRGVTVYKGHGGMGSKGISTSEQEILYCVVTRLEIGSIKNAVREMDRTAFITTHSVSDVEGGLVKKTAIH
jgi:uncharacterized membrane-anchored protein YitT (DUF2179 family)